MENQTSPSVDNALEKGQSKGVAAVASGSAGNYFPRTKRGWKNLFWITLGRCPQCKGALCLDPWSYSNDTAYCMPCGGAMYPNGFFRTIHCNKVATAKAASSPNVPDQPRP